MNNNPPRRWVAVMAGALTASGVLTTQNPADAKEPPFTHVIVVRSVKVHEFNRNGSPWDYGGSRPDLQVLVVRRDPKVERRLRDLEVELRKAVGRKLADRRGDIVDERGLEILAAIRRLEDSVTRRTRVVHGATEARFDQETLSVRGGERIRLIVQDRDLEFHDLIGQKDLRLPRSLPEGRPAEIRAGLVKSLVIEMKRLEPED